MYAIVFSLVLFCGVNFNNYVADLRLVAIFIYSQLFFVLWLIVNLCCYTKLVAEHFLLPLLREKLGINTDRKRLVLR